MASSLQRRCVFVGNIPYDATEEQLIDICREVGPVVSFRLVIDRETGKPKGYGFCEYKDEETALSARRNLQGYEINGRQLRVDFADNDKNADRNREQGRGGPGLAANSDFQKQVGGPAISGESAQHQPIGLHIAITAANVMAGALGGPQTGIQLNQAGLQGQSALASDPLTLHLAKMSRSQLLEIMSELKTMATQNKEAARQLLLAKPQLSKAFFQAQIMLGMVTPQVLQMPNIRQPSGQSALPSLQDPRQGQQPAVQTVPMLPPFAQRPPLGLVSKVQEAQLSAVPQSSLAQNQFSTVSQAPMQPQTQVPRHVGSRVLQQVTFPGNSGVPPLPPVQPSIRPQILVSDSSSNPQMQPSIQRSMVHDSREPMNRPSKLLKLDDGRSGSFLLGSSDVTNAAGSGLPQAFAVSSVPANPLPRPEELQHAEKPLSQLPSDVESALLQQVLNLSPEQLSSLPPAQRQQVIQLQQALRRDQLQPS